MLSGGLRGVFSAQVCLGRGSPCFPSPLPVLGPWLAVSALWAEGLRVAFDLGEVREATTSRLHLSIASTAEEAVGEVVVPGTCAKILRAVLLQPEEQVPLLSRQLGVAELESSGSAQGFSLLLSDDASLGGQRAQLDAQVGDPVNGSWSLLWWWGEHAGRDLNPRLSEDEPREQAAPPPPDGCWLSGRSDR